MVGEADPPGCLATVVRLSDATSRICYDSLDLAEEDFFHQGMIRDRYETGSTVTPQKC